MSPAVTATLQRLDTARQRWWTFSICARTVLAVAVSVAVLVLFVSVDALVRLPQGWLAVLFVTWCGASACLVAWTLYRSLQTRRSLMAAARRVEQAFPELGSHLINLVQLAGAPGGASEAFREAAIQDALAHVTGVPIEKAAHRHLRRARWQLGLQTPRDLAEVGGVLAAVLLLVFALRAAIPTWSSSVHRLCAPWQYVPQVGAVEILEVAPGDTTVLVGTRLDIVARIAPLDGAPPGAVLEVRSANESKWTRRPLMAGRDGARYAGTIPAVTAPMLYRVQVGDSQSAIYRADVEQRPTVVKVDVTYRYPAYLDLPPHRVTQPHADLNAPQYTEADLRVYCSAPLAHGAAHLGDREITGQLEEDGQVLVLRLELVQSTSYTIELQNRHGHRDDRPRVNRIQVAEDLPPTVELVKPAQDLTAVPDGAVPVVVRAADDHALAGAWLEWKPAGGESAGGPEPEVAYRWADLGGQRAAALNHHLALPPLGVARGDAIQIRAVVEDGRTVRLPGLELRPQRVASPWRRIELVDRAAQLADQLARLESWQGRLWAILELQLRTRARTAGLAPEQALPRALELGTEIRQNQLRIRQQTISLITTGLSADDPEATDLQRTLTSLAHDPMPRAVSLAERLTRIAHVTQAAPIAADLGETQDAIIEVLQRLLQSTRRATADRLAEMDQRPGGDLPNDVEQQLRDLHDRLQEFLRQQKRVIEATKNLAKKPVEDFTEQDEQLLKELAATEDDWSRFMEEMHSDFSKLPEQDFSNPSTLEEFIAVQTELKMAEGALTQKTVEIAVPLEQLGAEMAEEMTTNIEKWLPDTPDRERWSQEEPLTDAMKEAPMAELPGELEDIVGELMEDEEDLMDEMEDVSSSWADSGDKGMGWDALDGPISNMSARGVTGNRLPNTSEIGGRSGEGRQGQSSGEFVGDTAVGKGGRKTPSRLAPDPFVQGQVKDLSRDPVGGATGGGKESGAGGVGLEGPLRQQAQRDLQRLAEKQAELRNRAEAIDLQFSVLNYHREDLTRMIEIMASIERDLRSGAYQNALRRREVLLESLRHVQSYVAGEYAIRRDQSSNLPAEIQKEILAGMQDPSPEGWEELNRRYFQRLATGGPGSPAARPGTAAEAGDTPPPEENTQR